MTAFVNFALLVVPGSTWDRPPFPDSRGTSLRMRASSDGPKGMAQLVIKEVDRRKWDPQPDARFYTQPRFVQHVDDGFRERLTSLYDDLLFSSAEGEREGSCRILDLMSSWVSHLPKNRSFTCVGLGMNEDELRKNPQLSEHVVSDINGRPTLPFEESSFDAVICAVSVQYLVFPEKIFAEVHRVLKKDGVAIFSFSNRMFGQKAISAWLERDDESRVSLVRSYFDCVLLNEPGRPPAFSSPSVIKEKGSWLNLVFGGDPFFAVYARKK